MADTPIIDVIVHKQTDVLKRMLSESHPHRKFLNTPDSFHEDTPLHYAANHCDYEAICLLLDAGANVHVRNKFGYTALHMAAWYEQPLLAEKLIKAGADVNALDNDGLTPLHNATHNKNPKTANMLIMHGAKTDIEQEQVGSALDIARKNGVFMQLDCLRGKKQTTTSSVELPTPDFVPKKQNTTPK